MAGKKTAIASHMKKAIDRLEELSGTVNLLLEVIDARAPLATRFRYLEKTFAGCVRIQVFTRTDIADPAVTKEWMKDFRAKGLKPILFPFGRSDARKKFISDILTLSGMPPGETVKSVVIGLPNLGKSTVLNFITGKKSACVGAKPGITRGVQLVGVSPGFLILDTPGIVSMKSGTLTTNILHILTGCIQDNDYEPQEAADALLSILIPRYSKILLKFYSLTETINNKTEFYEALAKRRGFLQRGGMLDIEKTFPLLIRDFSAGRINPVSLQVPERDNLVSDY